MAPSNLGYVYGTLNVCSSVSLILVNKYIFSVLGFKYGAFLTICHMVTTAIAIRLLHAFGVFESKPIPMKEILILAGCHIGSIVFMNQNLILNNVGFYQLSKILIAPTVICFEVYFHLF